jgi:hypothetical protein
MPGLDPERVRKLAEETHYKPRGLESEYACGAALHLLRDRPGAALWGSSALNLCWIPQPRMLSRVEYLNSGSTVEEGAFILEREGAEAVVAATVHRRLEPLFGLVGRDVVTPFDELNTTFRTCQAEEVIAQIVLDLVRDGGILLAYDLSAVRQVAFDVEAVRRCLLVYLVAHGIPPDPGLVKERLGPLTDADIERDLHPVLADRVPMIMEVQFRAWNLAAIFYEYRGAEREFLAGAKAGAGNPGLLFPGRTDLADHPLTRAALEKAPGLL